MTSPTTGGHPDLKMVNPNACDMPVRAFGTFTKDLHGLAAWFKSCGVTSVAMEWTGVYWIPAFEILEAHGFDVILVNARYAKNAPGRKTDVSDAGWLRQLHSYGLLRGSSTGTHWKGEGRHPGDEPEPFGNRALCRAVARS